MSLNPSISCKEFRERACCKDDKYYDKYLGLLQTLSEASELNFTQFYGSIIKEEIDCVMIEMCDERNFYSNGSCNIW